MITTLAWVVLLTALTRPLRQVLRPSSPARSPESRMRSLMTKPNSRVRRVRQARSHGLGNLGILASYARDAGQEPGESRFPDPPSPERRHDLAGEQIDRMQGFRDRHVAEGEPGHKVI